MKTHQLTKVGVMGEILQVYRTFQHDPIASLEHQYLLLERTQILQLILTVNYYCKSFIVTTTYAISVYQFVCSFCHTDNWVVSAVGLPQRKAVFLGITYQRLFIDTTANVMTKKAINATLSLKTILQLVVQLTATISIIGLNLALNSALVENVLQLVTMIIKLW